LLREGVIEMKKINRIFTVFLFFAFIGFYCLSAGAQEHQGQDSPEGRRHAFREKMAEELGLTEDQQAQIDAQRQEHAEAMRTIRTRLQESRSSLKDELEKSDPDSGLVESLVEEINELMGVRLRQRVERVLLMKDVLTPEQEEKFKEHIEDMKEKRKSRKGQSRGMRPDGGF
jgi:Spy/CpxP family protein refolding chaperone